MDTIAIVEGCGAQVQGLSAKVKEVLERLHHPSCKLEKM
jgi:hypothetical protein